jgi:sugar-specific transcriptional regulator TrmB
MKKEDLSLTEVEFELFKRILEKGETPLGPIIKELGMHKGTVYNAIRRMEEKGLIGIKEVDGLNVYSINALSLKKYIDEETSKLEGKIKDVKEIIKHTEKSREKEETSKISILVGKESFKTFFNDLYDWARKTKKEYLFMGKGGEMIEYLGEEYYKTTQIRKKKLALKCRVILNAISKKLSVSKYVMGNVKYLKMDYLSPVSTWIYDNNVVIVLWDSKPISTIIIHSKGVSDSYKSFFEAMWKISSKK